ncbi:MAG: hypothetical protein KatS3mg087_1881 [Patescibacteria group bacterium]|nr:MAG: hypothetical protein KatS3mg087_1881 [Patescibacteria group bacterium]
MSEDKIQAQIVKYLRLHNDRCIVFHIPNGGTRNIIEASKFKRIGVLAGVADLVVLLPKGRCVFLEVKTQRGQQSERQKQFEKRVKELGFDYHIVRSVDDVINLKLV